MLHWTRTPWLRTQLIYWVHYKKHEACSIEQIEIKVYKQLDTYSLKDLLINTNIKPRWGLLSHWGLSDNTQKLDLINQLIEQLIEDIQTCEYSHTQLRDFPTSSSGKVVYALRRLSNRPLCIARTHFIELNRWLKPLILAQYYLPSEIREWTWVLDTVSDVYYTQSWPTSEDGEQIVDFTQTHEYKTQAEIYVFQHIFHKEEGCVDDKHEKILNKTECFICASSDNDICLFSCNHYMCKSCLIQECIHTQLKTSRPMLCPFCRTPLSTALIQQTKYLLL